MVEHVKRQITNNSGGGTINYVTCCSSGPEKETRLRWNLLLFCGWKSKVNLFNTFKVQFGVTFANSKLIIQLFPFYVRGSGGDQIGAIVIDSFIHRFLIITNGDFI